jgi:hypothetical protein
MIKGDNIAMSTAFACCVAADVFHRLVAGVHLPMAEGSLFPMVMTHSITVIYIIITSHESSSYNQHAKC